ncbi:hypothetical protein [Lapidilactobacillus gannanensis]|uniref:Uncharacterized protein n=1 Tax=Lapidilactobacillus gannanensis TaxID=2486002 RepID=A0ABW4BQ81_9LACO|nr:hypothetical protein [Lapidilactobacillus gannanensis]
MKKIKVQNKAELIVGLLLLFALLAAYTDHNYSLSIVFLITGLIFTFGGFKHVSSK